MNAFEAILMPHGGVSYLILTVMFVLVLAAIQASIAAGRLHSSDVMVTKWSHGAGQTDIEDAIKTGYDRRAEAIPGVILLVGLLGTFISLAWAINDAAAGLKSAQTDVAGASGTEALTHLSGLLDNMGTKFQTSIYGIALSLLTRAMVYSWCAKPRHVAVVKLRERAEFAADARLRDAVQLLRPDLAAICHTVVELGDRLARMSTDSYRATAKMESGRQLREDAASAALKQLMGEQTTRVCTAIQQHQWSSDRRLDDVVGKLSDVSGELSTLQSVSESLGESAHSMSNAADELRAGVTESLEKNRAVVEEGGQKLTDAAGELRQAVAESIHDLKDSLAAKLDGIEQVMTNLRSSNEDAIRKSQTALTDAMGHFEKSTTGTLEHIGSEMTNATSGMAGGVKSALDAMSTTLGSTLTRVSEQGEQTSDHLKKMMERLSESSAEAAKSSQAAMTEALAEFKDGTKRATEEMSSKLSNSAAETTHAVRNLEGALQKALDELKAAIGSMDGNFGEALTTLNGYSSKLTAEIKMLQDHMSKQGRSLDALSGEIVKMNENVATLKTFVKQVTSDQREGRTA